MSEFKTFVLTVPKYLAIVKYIAGLKRTRMHHIMRKNRKVEQQTMDLDLLNGQQAFFGALPLKAAALDKYESEIHKLAEEMGKAKEADRLKIIEPRKLSVALAQVAEYEKSGRSIQAMNEELISSLFIIDAEVGRAAVDEKDMTHEEYMSNIEEEKKRKARHGRDVLQMSSSLCSPASKRQAPASSSSSAVVPVVPLEGGNGGGSYVRHNDDVNLAEDQDEAEAPLAAEDTSASSKKSKRRAPAKRRGGTNVTASEGGVVANNLAVVDSLQDTAGKCLELLMQQQTGGGGGTALLPGPLPAASSSAAPAPSYEQQLLLLNAQQALADKHQALADLELKKLALQLELQRGAK